MAATSSAAAHQAMSRGTLLHTPLCSPSTSHSMFVSTILASKRGRSARAVSAAINRHAAPAVVAAAAVLEARSKDREGSATLDPAVWLNSDLSDAVADWGPPSTASSGNMGRSDRSGHYLGVIDTAEDSVAPGTAHDSGSNSTKPSSSSSRRRSQPRGRPNGRALHRLRAQYTSLFEQLEAEHTAMLHKHERDFMNLLYSGASQQHLQQQQRRHDMMLHKLQSKYSQKWGAPVARKVFFQASGQEQEQQQQQQSRASKDLRGDIQAIAASPRQQQQEREQQPQQQSIKSKEELTDNTVEAPVPQREQQQESTISQKVTGHREAGTTPQNQKQLLQPQQQDGINKKVNGQNRAAAASQRKQQQQQRRPSTVPSPSVSSSQDKSSHRPHSISSSSMRQSRGSIASVEPSYESVYTEPSFSAFDIPEDTPEVTAAAAAAQEEAATVQRFTNQMVGAKVIADALRQDPVDVKTLDRLEIVYLHLALPKLVVWRLIPLMIKLAGYLLARPDRDAHTYGSVFNAYALANRTDLALAVWEKLSSQGVDIGPYGSSALMKACAKQRDVAAALQVFDQLMRRRVSFNSYTYHCLLQLCCYAGRIEDALAVYNMQRLETSPDSLPNTHTYTALVRGLLVSGRVELTQQLFENMLEDGVTPDARLYCTFLNAAGKAGNLGLARYLYQHMLLSLDLDTPQQQQQQRRRRKNSKHGMSDQRTSINSSSTVADPTSRVDSTPAGSLAALVESGDDGSDSEDTGQPNMLQLVNALLFAHAQVGALQGALAVYRQELLGRALHPDAYTCTALLTAAARSAGASWSDVQDVVATMKQYDIKLTTQLGTALINAYRRVKGWHRPAVCSSRGEQQQQQQQQGATRDSKPGKTRAAADESSSIRSDEAVLQLTTQQDQQQLLAATGAPALPNVEPVVAAALHAARQVLLQLHQQQLATSNSYVTMLCFLLEQGQVGSFKQLYGVMVNGGVHPDEQGWEKLMYASGEFGMQDLLLQMRQEQELQQRRQGMAMRARPPVLGQLQ